ncbi:hypothetical protein AMJ71_10380, partial [candidate division TA06 bacterium SM1_40]
MDAEKRTILALGLIAVILFGYSIYIRSRAGRGVDELAREPSRRAVEAVEETDVDRDTAMPEPRWDGLTPLDSLFGAAAVDSVEREVVVETDLYWARLSTRGATLTSVRLKDYDAQNGQMVELIPEDAHAILGLWIGAGEEGIDLTLAPFTTDVSEVTLSAEHPEGEVAFALTLPQGGEVVRRYRFFRNRYDIALEIAVSEEIGARDYWLHWQPGLSATERNRTEDLSHFAGLALMGDVLVRKNRRDLVKIGRRSEAEDSELASYVEEIGDVRWAGVRTKYFVATLVPESSGQHRVRLMASGPEHVGFDLGGRYGESGLL